MSHIAVINAQIQDLDAFGEACAKLGAELRIGQKMFDSFTRGHCEHAIHVSDNAYEAGLIANPEGGWKLGFDNYGMRGQALERALGVGLVKVQDEYLAVVAERQLRRDGFMVTRYEENNQIQLRAYA